MSGKLPAEIVDRARAVRIEDEVERRGVRLLGRVERVGPCPVCGGTDRFSVNIAKQLWNCRGCGVGGKDAISAVMHIDGVNFRAAVETLSGEDMAPAPARVASPAPPKPKPDTSAFVAQLVANIVREIGPVRRSPGEQYLREIRQIDTEAIADVLERTDAVGWHPSLLFREEGHPLDGRRLGCIVGIMTEVKTAASTGAISRTWLTPDLAKVGKAKTLGSPAGIIRLSEDADVLEGLHIGEGIETALDAMSKGFRPAWATGSTAIMAKFPVLAGIEALTIFADHDQNGAGQRAASEAAERWLAAGREVRVYQRETTGDLNDAYREVRR